MDLQHQEYLTFSKAAALMGCTRQYIYKLVANGKLKASRLIIRMAFVRKADIEKMFEGNPYKRVIPATIHNDVLVIAYKVKRFELRQSDCHIFWQFSPVKVFKIFELREVSLVYHSPSTRLVTIFRLPVKEFCQEAVVRPLLGL